MPKKLPAKPALTDDEIRQIMLQYFYDRNRMATSMRGKKSGAAVTILVLRGDLKASHGLKAGQVVSNLTYLISQGWVEEKPLAKSWTTPRGGVVPAVTSYYVITAAGIDKIAGPSAFSRERFHGIKIEATGQNIITLGDGNQVNVRFREEGEALAALREAVKSTAGMDEATKLELVSDIDSIQDQLAKAQPNKSAMQALWQGIERTAALVGLAEAAARVAPHIQRLLGQ